MNNLDSNFPVRAAAFEYLRHLQEARAQLTAAELQPGFMFEGRRVALTHAQRTIFKPRQMRELLSIRTAFPEIDAKVWYDDPRAAHARIYAADETIDCTFKRGEPEAADGTLLREAMDSGVPLIYFLAVSPRRYQAIFPAFVVDWNATALRVKMAFGFSDRAALTLSESPAERRLALQAVSSGCTRQPSVKPSSRRTKEGAPSQGCWSLCSSTLHTLRRIKLNGPDVRTLPTVSRCRKSCGRLLTQT